MSDDEWEVVEIAAGMLQGEILRGLLEAQGVPTELSQDAVGSVLGLTFGPLGEVQILVPVEMLGRARQVLDEYYAGAFEQDDQEDMPDRDQPMEGNPTDSSE